jgi:hypothetical protein
MRKAMEEEMSSFFGLLISFHLLSWMNWGRGGVISTPALIQSRWKDQRYLVEKEEERPNRN